MNYTDLIFTIDNHLDGSVCDEIIAKFDRDDRVTEGSTYSGRVLPNVKRTLDLYISDKDDWKEYDKVLCDSTLNGINLYCDRLRELVPELYPVPDLIGSDHNDSGYKVKKYRPGDFFHWHQDQTIDDKKVRKLAFIWYLNDLEEDDDGYTEFYDGTKVYPKKGRLLVFPSGWAFVHRGYPPKKEKYTITSFVYGV